MNRSIRAAWITLAGSAAVLLPLAASAESTLHVGPGVNSPCATGGTNSAGPCQYLFDHNTETNGISGNEADIYFNPAKATSLTSLDVILGIPNDTTESFSSTDPITSAMTYEGPGGAAEATLSVTFVKPVGTMTAVHGDDEAYTVLGLTGANNSNSFVNWSGADLAVDGITATDFGLYEFVLTAPHGIDLEGQELVDLIFGDALPLGTFVIGYESQNGKVYDTPFTEAGIVTSETKVPEPGTIALFGAGLLGAALFARRRRPHCAFAGGHGL